MLKCSRSTRHSMIYATAGSSPGHSLGLAALSILLLSTRVLAAPSGDVIRRQLGSGSNSPSIGPAIWVPLALVGILLVVGTVVACFRRNINVRGRWQSVSTGAAAASGTLTAETAQSRELTAEQLAGEPLNGAGAGSARTRRPRRTRRTPSQISTRSLPVYMKEPGEQEVVIIRGPDEIDDEMPPTTVVMPPVDEYNSEHSLDLQHSVSFSYIAVSSPGTGMSLLHGEGDSANESQQHLRTHAQQPGLTTRSSFETIMSTDDVDSPPMSAEEPDSRGEAPPYFEVVTLDEQPETVSIDEPAAPAAASGPHDVQPGTNRRRTGFLSLFNSRTNSTRASGASSSAQNARGHARQESGLSAVSSNSSLSGARPTHRPSHSAGSNSVLSTASHALRSLSRARSRTELTSPSAISLHSISAPLSHTLVRTEFTYPRGGPTPDQLRLIASRESFVRFGVPYGADAIAYAASASRVDLEPPPPVFEDVESSPAQEGSEEASSLQEVSTSQEHASPSMPAQELEPPATAADEADSPSPAAGPQSSIMTEVPTTSPTAIEQAQAPIPETAAAAAAAPEAQPEPSSSTPPAEQPKATLTAIPSSYKSPMSAPSHRSASRASSYMTFATADEFTDASAPPTPTVPHAVVGQGEPSEDELETPSTPRAETRHVHEESDMTVMS
ncbi:hypothetical protein OBBRIDRAFT_884598 [Obba rivulosa]|uniref:Proteophosphoglycan ppg4 n=1 Tax=Obba rivulosa TaxID=1052685 RepID=A0A8E2DRR1_9APHY|nr:hypothetical protein OBBRIDRAFT_884598 [Obba rivulosa]